MLQIRIDMYLVLLSYNYVKFHNTILKKRKTHPFSRPAYHQFRHFHVLLSHGTSEKFAHFHCRHFGGKTVGLISSTSRLYSLWVTGRPKSPYFLNLTTINISTLEIFRHIFYGRSDISLVPSVQLVR